METGQKNGQYQHIGNIAKELGVSTRAIRYYEELGLIVPRRSDGGFREYSEPEVEKLKTILRLKKLGLPLEEIQKLVKMRQCAVDKKSAGELLKYLHDRMYEFEEKIKDYQEMMSDISNMIEMIKNCLNCKEDAELFKCETCSEKKADEIPPLMKAMF